MTLVGALRAVAMALFLAAPWFGLDPVVGPIGPGVALAADGAIVALWATIEAG